MVRSWAVAVLVWLGIPERSHAEWARVQSEHFTIITDMSESAGTSVAQKLESIRAIYAEGFQDAPLDPPQPIYVFALANESGLATLLPTLWEDDSKRKPDGLFREGTDKLYIALRLDAPSGGRYRTLYHEYFHLLARFHWGPLPLWLDEGMAKVWETTELGLETARVGVPSRRELRILATEPLVPLPVLFDVDHGSPMYQDAQSSARFYAQSWALVHYLLFSERRPQLLEYIRSARDVRRPDPAEAFGSLEALEGEVKEYIERGDYFTLTRPAPKPPDDVRAMPLGEAEVLAHRADFIAHGVEPSRARPWVQRALELDPELPLAHEAAGYVLLAEGKLDEAVSAFARAAALDAGSPLAYYYGAVAAARRGDTDDVFRKLERALAIRPDFVPAHLLVATASAELETRFDAGIESARSAIDLVPRSARAHQLHGRLLWLTGEDAEAEKALLKASALTSTDAAVYRDVGFDLIELGRFHEARAAFDKAARLSPQDARLRHAVGIAYLGAGELEASIEALGKAQTLAPEDAEIAFDLGLALAEDGQLEQAAAALGLAVELEPDELRYLYRSAEVLLRAEQYARAVTALERARELEPASVALRRDLGQALVGAARYDEAIPHLRAALAERPNAGALHFQLAMALQGAGAEGEAETHFARAKELGFEP